MPKVPRSQTVEFVAKMLKSNPGIAYTDIVKEGKKAGHHVYPLIVGLAKNTIGMGSKKKRAGKPGRKPGRPAGSGRGPGRPPKNGRRTMTDIARDIARLQDNHASMAAALRDIAKIASRF